MNNNRNQHRRWILGGMAAILFFAAGCWGQSDTKGQNGTAPENPSKTVQTTPPDNPTPQVVPAPNKPVLHVMNVSDLKGKPEHPWEIKTVPASGSTSGTTILHLPFEVNKKLGEGSKCGIACGGDTRYVYPGMLEFPVELPKDDRVVVFARVLFPDNCSNSIWYQFNEGPLYFMEKSVMKGNARWLWISAVDQGDPVIESLKKGKYILRFHNREDGISVDQVAVVSKSIAQRFGRTSDPVKISKK